jgi:hypothetical protein
MQVNEFIDVFVIAMMLSFIAHLMFELPVWNVCRIIIPKIFSMMRGKQARTA